MKRNFKRIISLGLTSIMILGSISPVFATVEEEQSTTKTENLSTDVYFNQDSTFSVTIPKKVVLDSNKESLYTVTVTGDISSDETVNVIPEEKFLMKDQSEINTKEDVEATVSQDKTSWLFNEFDTVANGEIKAPTLTAGNWEGKFFFNIELESNTVKVISVVDSNGTDLNGKSNNITGYDKEKLLSELTASELVEDTSNIKALIDVNTDDFENSATATFDVSKIAEANDQIVIYHYDEELATWEYITTATVDENGNITVDMTSFSPVAFAISQELEPGLYDANGVMLCTWEESGINVEKNYGNNLSADSINHRTVTTSGYYVLTNKYPTTTSIILPNDIERIGDCAFSGCRGLTNIIIPENVTSIGGDAFQWCTNLLSITIPKSITRIENFTFAYCSNLTKIIIPDTITYIGAQSIGYCYDLININYMGTEEQWNAIEKCSNWNCYTSATIIYNYTE